MRKEKKNANLPTELVDDILSRLPVEPLIRFRCVSKRWLALIESRDFIKLHLNRSIETRNNRSLIVTPLYSGEGIYWVNMDSPEIVAVEIINHPLRSSHELFNVPTLMGSCRGLVLLNYAASYGRRSDDTIIIWNPLTRNYQELPFPRFSKHELVIDVLYGIGYDSVHDDYKVVKIIKYFRTDHDSGVTAVKVYSLKSNTWRDIIHDFPYYLLRTHEQGHGVLASGALHWVVYDSENGKHLVGAFDLATEEYRLVPMPKVDDNMCHMTVAVLEGCLCLICRHWEERITDVWVMKSYGLRESRSKLISFRPLKVNEFIMPLAFSKNGRQVLLMRKEDKLISVIWFDIESKVEKTDDGCVVPSYSWGELVVQSLVPLGSGSQTHA